MSRRIGMPTAKRVTQLANVDEHVEGSHQVREAYRREPIDNYVKLISGLVREVGEACQVDMVICLGISQPTAAKMFKRLTTTRLTEVTPWHDVFLTAEGEKLTRGNRERYQIVENFLLIPGVSPEIARCDARNMGHHVSEETLDTFHLFTQKYDAEWACLFYARREAIALFSY